MTDVTIEVKNERAAADRAIFEKGMGVTIAAPPAEDVAPPRDPNDPRDRQVAPEVIWNEGLRMKEGQRLRAEAAAKLKGKDEEGFGPERERDETGKFKAKAVEKAAPAKDQDAEVSDEDFERAHAALVRSGFRKKELDGMDREEVVKRGLKRARALAADDEAHFVAKQQRGATPEGKIAGNEEKPAKATLPELPDKKAIMAKLSEKLGLDAEGASLLADTIDDYAKVHGERATAPLRQKLVEYEQRVAESSDRGIQVSLVKAQAALAESIPDLLDPDTFAQVTETMDTLSPAEVARYGRIANPSERFQVAMRDACQRLGLVAEESGGKSERRSPEAEARRHQRPTVEGRTRTAPSTAAEADREQFDESMARAGAKHGYG